MSLSPWKSFTLNLRNAKPEKDIMHHYAVGRKQAMSGTTKIGPSVRGGQPCFHHHLFFFFSEVIINSVPSPAQRV